MASNVDQWVARLKEAFSGIGTNEEEVMSVLKEAQRQMSDLVIHYPNLENELYDEFSADELKQVLHLFYEVSPSPSPDETQINNPQWVSRLYEAFNSGGILGGTDENEIMSVLRLAKNAGQMAALTNLYNQQHSDELSLEDELYDELSGDELKAALQLYYSGFKKTQIKITGTLVPSDPAIPFIPRYPLPEKGSIWVRMCLPPDKIDQYNHTLHLFSTSGDYSIQKKLAQYSKKDESSVYIQFEDTPEGDDSKYTLELIFEDGAVQPLFKNALYKNLKIVK